jgi:hypothetical protein
MTRSGTYYDPESPLPVAEWLAMPERERLRLVVNHLVANGKASGAKSTATRYVVAENFLAQGFGPAQRALDRMRHAGKTRAEALLAIAECLGTSYSRSASTPSLQQAAFAEALNNVQ